MADVRTSSDPVDPATEFYRWMLLDYGFDPRQEPTASLSAADAVEQWVSCREAYRLSLAEWWVTRLRRSQRHRMIDELREHVLVPPPDGWPYDRPPADSPVTLVRLAEFAGPDILTRRLIIDKARATVCDALSRHIVLHEAIRHELTLPAMENIEHKLRIRRLAEEMLVQSAEAAALMRAHPSWRRKPMPEHPGFVERIRRAGYEGDAALARSLATRASAEGWRHINWMEEAERALRAPRPRQNPKERVLDMAIMALRQQFPDGFGDPEWSASTSNDLPVMETPQGQTWGWSGECPTR